MAQYYTALRALAAHRGEDIGPARCGGSFPLTPSLSLGERVVHALCGDLTKAARFPLRDARCSLSLRERVRVRGNGAKYVPRIGPIPKVEIGEFFSGRA